MTAVSLCSMEQIETVPTDQTVAEAAVLRARAVLDAAVAAGREGRVSLQELSEAVGMSAAHLQRQFTAILGVSPSAYLRSRRAEQFRVALRQSRTVSAATFDAGYAASSRAYADAARHLGMTPSAYRRGGAGVTIRWAAADTALGRLVIGATHAGLCWVSLAASDETLVRELRDEFPRAVIEPAAADVTIASMLTAVVARLQGDRCPPNVAIDMPVTAFQQRVLDALMAIPFGETRSYAQIAAAVGSPGASRAVANVCASNRVAVVIPCHRVIHADGTMSGYRWGNEIKKALLQVEGASPPRGAGRAPAAVRRRIAR